MALLEDQFTTADAAPLTSPRTCEPGPGTLTVHSDTGNRMGISGGKLVVTGGASAWANPSLYGKDAGGNAFSRGHYFEFEVEFDAAAFQMFGWSNSTTLSLAALHHCFYMLDSQLTILRQQGDSATNDTAVMWSFLNTVYTVRIYALSSGSLWLIKGGQFGNTFRCLGYMPTLTDASIYPAYLNFNGQQTMDNFIVRKIKHDPSLFRAYYNGATSVAANTYKIGAGYSLDGISIGRHVGNPVLSNGTGWEATFVKDPWVLKDGATYKMWYAGFVAGTQYQIGYATSSDGYTWSKSVSNPVLARGTAGQWDANAVLFPMVYKDPLADASKRYRMIYTGQNAAGTLQLGYAYSADGESWTKGAANPVVTVGAGGAWDDISLVTGGIIKRDSTYYLFYGGTSDSSYPVPYQCGLVTFTDFEGTYTKSGNNPIVARKTGNQALTANTNAGSAIVTVADTSAFEVGEVVMMFSNSNANRQQNKILSIDSSTQLTLEMPAFVSFTTAHAAVIQSILRAFTPRGVALENGVWKMWGTGFQLGASSGIAETTYYATSSSPDSGWAYDHPNSPPLWLAMQGAGTNWDVLSSENPMFALDADTNQRVGLSSLLPSQVSPMTPHLMM